MDTPWDHASTIRAVREQLRDVPLLETGFRAVDVRESGGRLSIEFRWWRDPSLYAVEIDFPQPGAIGWMMFEPVYSVDDWAAEIGWSLREELDTGLVTRAGRQHVDGRVVLPFAPYDPDSQEPASAPEPHYVSLREVRPRVSRDGVSMTRFGTTHVGGDESWPSGVHQSGPVLTWAVLFPNVSHPQSHDGQAVTTMIGDDVDSVRLDVLEVGIDVPDVSFRSLLGVVLHEAARYGASKVTTRIADPRLTALGFGELDDAGEYLIDLADPHLTDW